MEDSTPAMLRLWRANSLLELGDIAREEGLREALAQPIRGLWEKELGPDAAKAVSSVHGLKGSMTLGHLLGDRDLHQDLRRLLAPAHRRELLRAARALLERRSAEVPAQVAAPAAVKSEHQAPRTYEALERWAKAQGVSEALLAPLEVLEGVAQPVVIARAREHGGPTLALDDLVAVDDYSHARIYRTAVPELRMLRDFAWTYLQACAEDVHRGVEEERAREAAPRPPPAHPVLAQLQERLLEARARVRKHAMPRSAQTVSKGKLTVGAEPPVLHYAEPGKVVKKQQWTKVDLKVTIGLDDWQTAPLRLECTCRPGASCTHALAALDAMLQFLAAPDPAVAANVIDTLTLPKWGRALRALSKVTRVAAEAPAARLTWRVRVEPHTGLRIAPYLQKETKRGGYSAGTKVALDEIISEGRERFTPADVRAATLLSQRYPADSAEQSRQVLEQLVGHPLVLLDDGGELSPLVVAEAELSLACVERDGGFELSPVVAGEEVPPALLERLAARRNGRGYWLDPARKRCLLVHAPHRMQAAFGVLETFGAEFPAEAAEQLAEKLDDSGLEVDLPASLCGAELPPSTAPMVYLSPFDGLSLEAEARVRPLPLAAPMPAGSGPSRARGKVDGARAFTRRDLEAERKAALALWAKLALPCEENGPVQSTVQGPEALDLLVKLEALSKDGLEVHWPPKKPRISRPARGKDLRVQVREGRDWFGLEGSAEVDGERVELAMLLEAARRKERYVKLSDDRFVALSEELSSQLQPLADQVFTARSGSQVGPSAAPILEQLAESLAEVDRCQSFRALAEKFRAARDSNPEVPPELKATLRDYQRDGFKWLARLADWGMGACLADDMGLGKTLEALALLVHRRALGPSLVVAPTSVCFNWLKEAEKFAPCLKVHSYREANREAVLSSLGPGDVVVASYGLVTGDVARFKAVTFQTLVIDEAQAIKNAQTRRAKALRELDAVYRVALTGTPVENHVGELWSLFRLLVPGLLGSQEQFRERFGLPIEREKTPVRRQALARLLRPFLLRRTKGEVASELPARTEVTVPVALSVEERRLYEDARLAAVAELSQAADGPPQQKRFQVLAALTRLRLLSCHPRLHDASWTGPASKLETLLSLVGELKEEGHRALVFSQFTRHLEVVREALDARGVHYLYLDGQTPEAERRRRVEAFQAGEGSLFLISLKAGGTGLNLTGADNVIHLDPWWNPAVEDQATDRAHRIGQARPVTVYRLVTKGTIEEAILQLHAEKRELVAGLLEGTGTAAKMGTEELAALLEAGARLDSEEDTPAD
jgi:superfamily II DNA or RNA helicase